MRTHAEPRCDFMLLINKGGLKLYDEVNSMSNNKSEHNNILKKIEDGIRDSMGISYFIPYYKILSQKTAFIGSTLKNDWFYRARIATDKLFKHTNELKYPPREFASKGRLNDYCEQIAYLTTGEIAPIAELDIGYYQLFCMIKIRHVIKNTIFYYVGVKGQYESHSNADIEVNNFYMNLLTSRGSENYNATIALGRHFLGSGIFDKCGKHFRTGIIYNSVHEEKSNKLLYNIAVYPDVFDECCRIEEAFYYSLTYNPKKNANIMYDINKGTVHSDGVIQWKKSYSEMANEFERKFSNDIFKSSHDSVIHYKYGVGKIIKENKYSYVVAFSKGAKSILKEKLIVV